MPRSNRHIKEYKKLILGLKGVDNLKRNWRQNMNYKLLIKFFCNNGIDKLFMQVKQPNSTKNAFKK